MKPQGTYQVQTRYYMQSKSKCSKHWAIDTTHTDFSPTQIYFDGENQTRFPTTLEKW